MFPNPITLLGMSVRAFTSERYARQHRAPGMAFDHFGRRLGLRILPRRPRAGLIYMLNPVNSVRYLEFPFAKASLPTTVHRCLDISSPRMFSFYVASHFPQARVEMLNPHAVDLNDSADLACVLGLKNMHFGQRGVETLAHLPETYDCIWSISVIEHISGDYDDRQAVPWLYDALQPGGRLILTVPVDRKHWDEYRAHDPYGTQQPVGDGSFFFQRYYDEDSIRERILEPIGQTSSAKLRWFGEVSAGRFAEYERRWMREGLPFVVDTPREIADYYREFDTWQEMPGKGVCGIVIDKPA